MNAKEVLRMRWRAGTTSLRHAKVLSVASNQLSFWAANGRVATRRHPYEVTQLAIQGVPVAG